MKKQRTKKQHPVHPVTGQYVGAQGSPARKLRDRVVIGSRGKGTVEIERLASGRFTTETSAARIDETVNDFAVVLERLAKK